MLLDFSTALAIFHIEQILWVAYVTLACQLCAQTRDVPHEKKPGIHAPFRSSEICHQTRSTAFETLD